MERYEGFNEFVFWCCFGCLNGWTLYGVLKNASLRKYRDF
jgi:hypothetical protein